MRGGVSRLAMWTRRRSAPDHSFRSGAQRNVRKCHMHNTLVSCRRR